MSGREKEELQGVSLLGNQKTVYKSDYAPEVLETFINKHPENDYFVKFTVRSLQVFVRGRDSRILQPFTSLMYRESAWLRANH